MVFQEILGTLESSQDKDKRKRRQRKGDGHFEYFPVLEEERPLAGRARGWLSFDRRTEPSYSRTTTNIPFFAHMGSLSVLPFLTKLRAIFPDRLCNAA